MVHEVDLISLGIREGLRTNYSTADKAYNSGNIARPYMFDSQIYQDRVKQTLFRGKDSILPDSYNKRNLDSVISSSYSDITSKYLLPSKMQDNYLDRQSGLYQ